MGMDGNVFECECGKSFYSFSSGEAKLLIGAKPQKVAYKELEMWVT